jgi:hypothetical protein
MKDRLAYASMSCIEEGMYRVIYNDGNLYFHFKTGDEAYEVKSALNSAYATGARHAKEDMRKSLGIIDP